MKGIEDPTKKLFICKLVLSVYPLHEIKGGVELFPIITWLIISEPELDKADDTQYCEYTLKESIINMKKNNLYRYLYFL